MLSLRDFLNDSFELHWRRNGKYLTVPSILKVPCCRKWDVPVSVDYKAGLMKNKCRENIKTLNPQPAFGNSSELLGLQ